MRLPAYRSIYFSCALIILGALYYFHCAAPSKPKQPLATLLTPQSKPLVTWLQQHTTWHQTGSTQGWAGFDKVYFIALPDRLQHVTQVADRLGVAKDAWILHAINKHTLDIAALTKQNIVAQTYADQLDRKQYGAIGCQLSHLAVILDCYLDAQAKTCVIFEDDLYKPAAIVSSQVASFHSALDKLNIQWDMLFLDYCMEEGNGKTQGDVRWLSGSYCTHAYVIQKHIAPLLLTASIPMQQAIDNTYYQLTQNHVLTAIGPDKARYFAQNRFTYDSSIDPGYKYNPQLILRYR